MSPAYPTVFVSCNNLGIKLNGARNRASAGDGIPGWDSLAVYRVMALADAYRLLGANRASGRRGASLRCTKYHLM